MEKKPTYRFEDVVHFECGSKLSKKVIQWEIDNKRYSLRLGGYLGPQGMSCFFAKNDGRELNKFLQKKLPTPHSN